MTDTNKMFKELELMRKEAKEAQRELELMDSAIEEQMNGIIPWGYKEGE